MRSGGGRPCALYSPQVHTTALWLGYLLLCAGLPALAGFLLLKTRFARPLHRLLARFLRALDRGLLLLLERLFGPKEQWRLWKWLRRRNGLDDYPDPSIGRSQGRS